MRMLVFVALAVVAIPAAAKPGGKGDNLDPNKVICRSNEVIGSRLQTARTCLTRAQWKQQEAEQRRTVQRIQDFKPYNGG